MRLALAALFALAALPAAAQQRAEAVDVTGLRNTVDKSYRRMVAGMDRFEQRRGLAPQAPLRFRLLPRHRGTRMDEIELHILGDSFETPVEVAADRTFVLPRDPIALKEAASVRPNRKKQTMTWRADIRTPGLPPGTRRLGDLRLECEVGIAAGLISNTRTGFAGVMQGLVGEGPEYCSRQDPRYLFFADRPLWSVTLAHGERRETLPVDRLYASATRDPGWREELPYCDCEVLLDRTYFMPLGDRSWPDDTLVLFEYMDEPANGRDAAARREAIPELRGNLGTPAAVVAFDSGYQAWVYRDPPEKNIPRAAPELVVLFPPSGVLSKTRVRQRTRMRRKLSYV